MPEFNFSVTPPQAPKNMGVAASDKKNADGFNDARAGAEKPETKKPVGLSAPKDPLIGKTLAEGDGKEAKAEGEAFLRNRSG